MISTKITLDHANPTTPARYAAIYREWSEACSRSLLSPKQLRCSNRVKRRVIERKNCRVNTENRGTDVIKTFLAGETIVGILAVTFKNFKPDLL